MLGGKGRKWLLPVPLFLEEVPSNGHPSRTCSAVSKEPSLPWASGTFQTVNSMLYLQALWCCLFKGGDPVSSPSRSPRVEPAVFLNSRFLSPAGLRTHEIWTLCLSKPNVSGSVFSMQAPQRGGLSVPSLCPQHPSHRQCYESFQFPTMSPPFLPSSVWPISIWSCGVNSASLQVIFWCIHTDVGVT